MAIGRHEGFQEALGTFWTDKKTKIIVDVLQIWEWPQNFKFSSLKIEHDIDYNKLPEVYRTAIPEDVRDSGKVVKYFYLYVLPEIEKLLDLKIIQDKEYEIKIAKTYR